jgi:hypothetical protein
MTTTVRAIPASAESDDDARRAQSEQVPLAILFHIDGATAPQPRRAGHLLRRVAGRPYTVDAQQFRPCAYSGQRRSHLMTGLGILL